MSAQQGQQQQPQEPTVLVTRTFMLNMRNILQLSLRRGAWELEDLNGITVLNNQIQEVLVELQKQDQAAAAKAAEEKKMETIAEEKEEEKLD